MIGVRFRSREEEKRRRAAPERSVTPQLEEELELRFDELKGEPIKTRAERFERAYSLAEKALEEMEKSVMSIGTTTPFITLPYLLASDRDVTIILLGPPGIGKTELIRDLAAYEAWKAKRKVVEGDRVELLEIRQRLRARLAEQMQGAPPRVFDISDILSILPPLKERYTYLEYTTSLIAEEDVQGIPALTPSHVLTEYSLPFLLTFPLLPGEKEEDSMGLIFLDELTNPQLKHGLQSAVQRLVYERMLGKIRLPKGVRVIAAANPPEASDVARTIPVTVRTRVFLYDVEPPTVEDWLKYMNAAYGDEWFKPIGLFLIARKDLFFDRKAAEERVQQIRSMETGWHFGVPTPREWTMLACSIYKRMKERGKIPLSAIYMMAVAAVGPQAAQELLLFLLSDPPSLSEVFEILMRERSEEGRRTALAARMEKMRKIEVEATDEKEGVEQQEAGAQATQPAPKIEERKVKREYLRFFNYFMYLWRYASTLKDNCEQLRKQSIDELKRKLREWGSQPDAYERLIRAANALDAALSGKPSGERDLLLEVVAILEVAGLLQKYLNLSPEMINALRQLVGKDTIDFLKRLLPTLESDRVQRPFATGYVCEEAMKLTKEEALQRRG